jgi:hypothetical protein
MTVVDAFWVMRAELLEEKCHHAHQDLPLHLKGAGLFCLSLTYSYFSYLVAFWMMPAALLWAQCQHAHQDVPLHLQGIFSYPTSCCS